MRRYFLLFILKYYKVLCLFKCFQIKLTNYTLEHLDNFKIQSKTCIEAAKGQPLTMFYWIYLFLFLFYLLYF